MSRSIDIRPKARIDIWTRYRRLEQLDSKASAERWYTELIRKIRTLAEDSRLWPEADEAIDIGIDLRCMPYGRGRHKYRVLFTIDGDAVNVLRIRHTAQDAISGEDL
ncbi:MAG TPA: type II toxin-antitoxin system RelE/ParE family toxin [Gemmataceae bacterium]|jgi:plasmid stabilization system protein ParE